MIASRALHLDDRRRTSLIVGGFAALLTAILVGDGLEAGGLRAGEASSIATSWRSWSAVFDFSRGSNLNGLLYRVGLKIWMFGGTSTGWLRVSSALCVVVAVGIVAWLATRLVNRTAGLVTAAVLMFSGTVLELGQDVRFYAPMMAISAASLAAWTADMGRPRRVSIGLWSICSFLLVGCSAAAIVVIFGQLLSLRLHAAPRRRWRRRLIAAAPSIVLCALVIMTSGVQGDLRPFRRVLSFAGVADLLYLLSGSGGWQGLMAYLVVGAVALRAVLKVVHESNSAPRFDRGFETHVDADSRQVFSPMVMAPWLIVACGLVLFVGASFVPTSFMGRYPAFLIPAVALALGCGTGLAFEKQRPTRRAQPRSIAGVALPRAIVPLRSNRQLLGVLLAGVALFFGAVGGSGGWREWRSAQRIDWAPVVNALAIEASPNDAVLFGNDSVRLSFDYYLRQDPDLVFPSSAFPSVEWGGYGVGSQRYRSFGVKEVSAALKTHRRIWLIIETPLVEHPTKQLAVVLERFDAVLVHSFGPTAVVYRIDVRP